jgi:hypothetical protein
MMVSLTVLIIRHAEKEGEVWPGPGLRSNGLDDSKSLVIRGWQRAGSWAALFGTGMGGPEYPKPSAIYAADPHRAVGDQSSHRPFETIIPLADRLRLVPVTEYAVGEETKLAATTAGSEGVVLVCWEHKAIIGELLPAITKDQVIGNLPKKWDAARYDIVLRLDRESPENPWFIRQLFPCLLFDDSDTPMS